MEPATPEEGSGPERPNAPPPPGPVMDFYLFEKAKALHHAGHFQLAEECYRQLLERDPRSVKALNNLGTLLEGQKRTTDAEAAYRRALEIDPNAAPVLYNLAHALHTDGRLDEAERNYRKSLGLQPGSFATLFNLGRLLQRQRRFDEAAECYRRAAEIAPGSTEALTGMGESLFGRGRFLEALMAFVNASTSDPQGAIGHFHVGRTLDVLDRPDEAEPHYRRAIELDPREAAPRLHLVRLLDRVGRRDDAVAAMAEWRLRMPDDPIAVHLLAALSQVEVPLRASAAYVRTAFDSFAENFEATLAHLGYRGPELIGMGLAGEGVEATGALDVLDLGCGTGLAGHVLRPYARRLVGMDLSPAMLAEAARAQVYDELVEGDLVTLLDERVEAFDLIAAADTFIYFGALETAIAGAAKALRPGGRLIFTVERFEPAGHEPWRLTSTGRYAHAERYVREVLERAGLTVARVEPAALRQEFGMTVAGLLAAAQR